MWESLLFLQVPGCLSAEHSLAEALQEFVMTRLEVGTAPMADRHAAHKRMVAVQDKQEDWFVYKVPRALRGAAGGGGDGGGGGLGLLSDTVNMGRRTLTQVGRGCNCCLRKTRYTMLRRGKGLEYQLVWLRSE